MVFSFVIRLNVKAANHNCKIITHCSGSMLYCLEKTGISINCVTCWSNRWARRDDAFYMDSGAGNGSEFLLGGRKSSRMKFQFGVQVSHKACRELTTNPQIVHRASFSFV